VPVVRSIGLWSPRVQDARIRGWMAAQKKAPAHRYGLGDFGLHSQDLTQMAGVV
jgi:hypothetical protein